MPGNGDLYGRAYVAAFADTVSVEGSLSLDPQDKGNWTGGQVGKGKLVGTKYGVSAAAFPTLDIPSLTVAQVEVIYFAACWKPINGDALPVAVARVTFDAAVNSGVSRAIKLLQQAAGATVDGALGPGTMRAVVACDPTTLAVACLVERALFMASLPLFPTYGRGWLRRLFHLKESVA